MIPCFVRHIGRTLILPPQRPARLRQGDWHPREVILSCWREAHRTAGRTKAHVLTLWGEEGEKRARTPADQRKKNPRTKISLAVSSKINLRNLSNSEFVFSDDVLTTGLTANETHHFIHSVLGPVRIYGLWLFRSPQKNTHHVNC